MLNEIFREYDIRGIFGEDLTQRNVKALGVCLGTHFKARGVKTVSVGYDARLSADAIFGWLLSGLNQSDLEIYDIGLLPTPVGYYSVFTEKFDANIMITGSHNPKEYNGFKITIFKDSFFGTELAEFGKKVIKFAQENREIPDNKKAQKFDILSDYLAFLSEQFKALKNFKTPFVIDCANGATGAIIPQICQNLGLNAKILFAEPDGNFPNHHPDPSIKENLRDIENEIAAGRAKFGFGFDGDGDRIAVLTEKRDIKGDELAYLYALKMQNPAILGEVKFSQMIYDEIAKFGRTFISKTGHSNIKKAIKENPEIALGAEVSGHIYFKERYFGFDDATYAMLRVLELVQSGLNLDAELDKLPKVFSTDEIKVKTTEAQKFAIVERLKAKLKEGVSALPEIREINETDGARVHFKDGWALVRASNTTPVIVTRFEAQSAEFRDLLQKEFMKLLDECM